MQMCACVCLLWYKLYHVQFMLHACVCAALKHVYLHYISSTLYFELKFLLCALCMLPRPAYDKSV